MLDHYRVLDLTNERGLLCGQILGDLGADVIKLEPPGGSSARRMAPFFQNEPDAEGSLVWWAYNRNKRAISLDISHPEGKQLLRRLARQATWRQRGVRRGGPGWDRGRGIRGHGAVERGRGGDRFRGRRPPRGQGG